LNAYNIIIRRTTDEAKAILRKWGLYNPRSLVHNKDSNTGEDIMKVAYPVIFTDVDTNILVEVPDLEILTEANEEGKEKGSISDAIQMARDAIGLACINLQDENKPVPEPTAITDIDMSKGTFAEDGRGIVSLVDVNLTTYRRMVDNKMVLRKFKNL